MESHNIENRVYLLQDRVVYVRELEKPTPEAISESAQHIRKLSQDWDRFSIVVEFPTFVMPNAAVRHRVVEEVLPLKKKLDHVAVVTKTNVFMNITIKFVGSFSGFKSISTHKTRESALNEVMRRTASIR
jgi:stress-induced morphogen